MEGDSVIIKVVKPGIRETLNKNPAITTGATAAIILIAIGVIIYQIMGGGTPGIATEAYYTIATYYWEKAYRDFTTPQPDKVKFVAQGIEAIDKALAAAKTSKMPKSFWSWDDMIQVLDDTLDVDIFSPPRQDWLDKSDAYLRQK